MHEPRQPSFVRFVQLGCRYGARVLPADAISGARSAARAATRPCRRGRRAAAPRPPIRAARGPFRTDGQRRWTSTSKLGRCASSKLLGVLAARLPDQLRRSATVSSSEAEMLKSSFSPAGDAIAVTIPSAMSSTWVSVRVCSPLPKICSGRWPGQDLGDQVRHRVGDPGLVAVGELARAVGVERAADRVAQPVLVVGGARVHLARQLGEPVRRARRRTAVEVRLGRRKLGRALEHHRRRDVREPLDALRRTAAWTIAPVSALLTSVSVNGSLWKLAIPPTIAARWITCEQPSTARWATARSRRSPVWTSQPSRIHVGALAMVGDANLPRRIAEQAPDDGGADRSGAARHEHAGHQWPAIRGRVDRRRRDSSSAAASAA